MVDGVIYHKTEYRERRDHYAVYGVNAPVVSFDTDRDSFVGPYNSLGEAAVPFAGRATGSVASGWYPIASHALELELAPGESRDLVLVLGYVENPDEEKWADDAKQVINKSRAHELLGRFATSEQVDDAFEALRAYWTELLSTYAVHSGDEKLAVALRVLTKVGKVPIHVGLVTEESGPVFRSGVRREAWPRGGKP